MNKFSAKLRICQSQMVYHNASCTQTRIMKLLNFVFMADHIKRYVDNLDIV